MVSTIDEHSSRPGPIASLSSNPSEQGTHSLITLVTHSNTKPSPYIVAAAKQRVNRLDNDYERCSAELSMISDREKEVQDGIAQLQSQLNELENHAQGLRQSLGNGQYELGNLGLKTKSLLDVCFFFCFFFLVMDLLILEIGFLFFWR